MASGKTQDFSTKILQWFASGTALDGTPGQHSGLYVALLSALPADPDTAGPFAGSSLSAHEVSSGYAYRAFLSVDTLTTIEKDTVNDAMQISNQGAGTEVTFPVAPANFAVSGYMITETNAQSDTDTGGEYIAYEFFTGADASKRRSVIAGDTIKINTNGLVIREK